MNITPDWLTAIATLILVGATIVYVYFTYRLTKETTKLREIETTPFISMYIKPDYILSLVIENIGKAPAIDVEFEMDEKYSQYFSSGCDFKHKISYFSPNQQLIISMGSFAKLEKLDFDHFPIKVKYYSKERKKFEYTFKIEWKYLSGSSIEQDNLEKIRDEIKKTTGVLNNICKTLKDKEFFVTNKLKILVFETNEKDINIIFSNGFITNIPINDFINAINIKCIEDIYKENGNLYDYHTNTLFLAEEIYQKIKNISNRTKHT